jgi:hypothetical protein
LAVIAVADQSARSIFGELSQFSAEFSAFALYFHAQTLKQTSIRCKPNVSAASSEQSEPKNFRKYFDEVEVYKQLSKKGEAIVKQE